MIVVLTTVDSHEAALSLAEKIVNEKLAACVQILPKMASIYFWDGAVQRDEEHLLLIKTREDRYTELEDFIRCNHTYDVPELVALRPVRVSDDYRGWLDGYLNG